MPFVHHCRSCGFISTCGPAFTRLLGVKVCKECKDDYGTDDDVTRWVDAAVARDAETKEEAVSAVS